MGNRCSIQQSEESNCWLEQSHENRLYRLFRSFWATLYNLKLIVRPRSPACLPNSFISQIIIHLLIMQAKKKEEKSMMELLSNALWLQLYYSSHFFSHAGALGRYIWSLFGCFIYKYTHYNYIMIILSEIIKITKTCVSCTLLKVLDGSVKCKCAKL